MRAAAESRRGLPARSNHAASRWLLGTYNKPPEDLTRYLAEFCFRSEFAGDPQAAFETLLGLAIKRAGRP